MTGRFNVLMLAVLIGSSATSCSDSTSPPDDGTPVTIEMPHISIPLLAASGDRLFTLQAVDSTKRELSGRTLSGDVRWSTEVPPCPSGLECLLAIDGASNVYMNTADGLMSRRGSNGVLRWVAASIQTPSIAVSSSGKLFAPGRPFTATQLMSAIDAGSGAITWTSILPPGLDATATLLDESRSVVYAAGRGGATALDAGTGAIKWIATRNCFGGSRGAIAADGTIYVTCDADLLSRLYAYDPAGNEKWHADVGTTNVTLAPVIDADGAIYIANRTSVTALNPDGSMAWRMTGLFRNGTHPVIDSNRSVYVAASRISGVAGRYLYGINHGHIADDRGLLSCSGSLLLSEAGRIYCAEIGLVVHVRTAGSDRDAQWSQIAHDAGRTARR